MSEPPRIGPRPASQSRVGSEQSATPKQSEAQSPQHATLQVGDGMADPRPSVPSDAPHQPLDGAFAKQASTPRPGPNLRGLETDPRILSQATLSLLTTPNMSVAARATLGQWVDAFE